MVVLDELATSRATGQRVMAASHRCGEVTALRVDGAGGIQATRRDRRRVWSPWMSVSTDSPLWGDAALAAVEIADGELAVFAVGVEGQVGVIRNAGHGAQTWSPWSLAPQGLTLSSQTPLTAVLRSAGRVELAGVATSGEAVRASWSASAGWSPFQPLADGEPAAGTPISLVSRAFDCGDAFTVAADGGVYSAWFTDESGWSAWSRRGGINARRGLRIAAVVRSSEWLQLVALTAGGWVATTSWRAHTGWDEWTPLAGGLTGYSGLIDAVALRPGRVEVVMTGFDDRVQVLTDDGGTGLGPARWQSIGGPVVARERGLCVVATGGDGLAVLVTDGECQPWIVDRSGGNDWGPWIRVGS